MKKKKKTDTSIMDTLNDYILGYIQRKTGRCATIEDATEYLSSLNEKELSDLAEEALMDMLFGGGPAPEISKDDFPPALMQDGHEDNDGDDSTYEHKSTGIMECMPAVEIKKYTLRIKLRNISPSIWRKIVVPSSIKLTSLADIIVDAMGWWDEHLHQFRTKDNTYYATKYLDKEEMEWTNSRWGGDYSIAHLLKEEKDRVVFEYDFGDGWEHEVTLNKIEDFGDEEEPYVKLLSGKRACPPEDCGGVPGYYELCEAMKHPRSARAKEYREWLGATYHPEDFDFEEAECIVYGYNYNDFGDGAYNFDDEEEDDN